MHRVADRLIREVDARLVRGEAPELQARLVLPSDATWAPTLQAIRVERTRARASQRWEQALLPLRTADALLVNLANLSPVAHRRKLTLIHDAQFLISPESFTRRQRWGYRLLTPLMTRTSRRVLTVSEYARDSLDGFGVSPRRRTVVSYNGGDHILEADADGAALARHGLAPGGYVLLFGSAMAYKNVEVVFRAFGGGALAPLRLMVVGPSREALAAAGRPPPADAVMAGGVSDAELRALYEGALCLAFPSRTEGFGLPPLEAMLCGCPSVVAPAGALPEVGRDAVLYADVSDPAGWAAQIRALRDDPALRAAKVAAGRARAAAFTWREAGGRLLDHLRELSADPR